MVTEFYCTGKLYCQYFNKKHYNYVKEAFLLLAQSHFLSERKKSELKWNRTVNVHIQVSCNIPVDLHMEHLN